MEAMIFAAGLGTRLQPITNTVPKALVEIDGMPLLERCIRKLISYGCSRIVVNVHHLAEQIIQFLNTKDFDVEILISDERGQLLDTGGGLKKAEILFTKKEPILIHNADVLSYIDLREMYNTHCSSGAVATLAVADRNTSRYFLFDDSDHLVGWNNNNTSEILWAKKTELSQTAALAFSGIHIINPEVFNLLPPIGVYSIVPQYINMAMNFRIKAFRHPANQWLDVGKLETIAKAHDFVNNQPI